MSNTDIDSENMHGDSTPKEESVAPAAVPQRTKPTLPKHFNKAKEALVGMTDKNNDGKVDAADVAIVAEQIGTSAKKATFAVRDTVKNNLDQASSRRNDLRREKELKTLQPIFPEDLEREDFYLPKLIRIAPANEAHRKSEVCQGSIGHETEQDGFRMLTIYPNYINAFGIMLYPNGGQELYYADPYVPNKYLVLEDYYDLIISEQVSELERIVQALGAKHFVVSSSHESKKNTSSANNTKVGMKLSPLFLKTGFNAAVSSRENVTSEEGQKILSTNSFPGHSPRRPELVYFKNNSPIETLVSLRMDDNILERKKYSWDVIKISGLTKNDAVKIDGVLRKSKCGVAVDIVQKAHGEEHTQLNFEIEF
ncbi:MAG: hypothetical protein IIY36_09265 [Lachnospiraceae bacterium]|nr:hypothetical protein [Lachnospiraceae bacterium]